MQALIATSRSVTQDLFLQRENQRKYKQHITKVQSIKHLKDFPTIEQARETQRMTKTIYKYKQSAKTFREQEQKTEIKRQNRILLEKIWKMSSTLKTDSNVMHLQHQSGSNWVLKKKQADQIKEQNKRLGVNLMSTKTDVKEYKKKLGQEIKQYLELRNNIRKFNTEGDKKRKLSRAKSEKKGLNLKLKFKDDDQENDNNNKEIQDHGEGQKEIKLFKTTSRKKLKNNDNERKQNTERLGSKKQEQNKQEIVEDLNPN